jgi:DNA polymerase-4
VSIKVRFADFSTITRAKTLDLPITSTQEIFEVAKNLYLALKLDRALVRLVGISLDSLVENEGIQQMVLGQRTLGWKQADKAVDQIKAKFGRGSLRPARLVEGGEDNQDDL